MYMYIKKSSMHMYMYMLLKPQYIHVYINYLGFWEVAPWIQSTQAEYKQSLAIAWV